MNDISRILKLAGLSGTGEKKQLNEGERIVHKEYDGNKSLVAKIYYNSDVGEFRAVTKFDEPGSEGYFTDDKEDAIGTVRMILKGQNGGQEAEEGVDEADYSIDDSGRNVADADTKDRASKFMKKGARGANDTDWDNVTHSKGAADPKGEYKKSAKPKPGRGQKAQFDIPEDTDEDDPDYEGSPWTKADYEFVNQNTHKNEPEWEPTDAELTTLGDFDDEGEFPGTFDREMGDEEFGSEEFESADSEHDDPKYKDDASDVEPNFGDWRQSPQKDDLEELQSMAGIEERTPPEGEFDEFGTSMEVDPDDAMAHTDNVGTGEYDNQDLPPAGVDDYAEFGQSDDEMAFSTGDQMDTYGSDQGAMGQDGAGQGGTVSFRSQAEAEEMMRELEAHGIQANLRPSQGAGGEYRLVTSAPQDVVDQIASSLSGPVESATQATDVSSELDELRQMAGLEPSPLSPEAPAEDCGHCGDDTVPGVAAVPGIGGQEMGAMGGQEQAFVVLQLGDETPMGMEEDEGEFDTNPDAMVDVGDDEVDATEYPYDDAMGAETGQSDGMDDAAGIIQQIAMMQDSGMSNANAHYDPERLATMPIDRIYNVLQKVMGDQVAEEDANWGGEPGYQTEQPGGHVTYDPKDLFPSGQATNAVKRVSNTAGDHSDNPMATVDPVAVGETVEQIRGRLEENLLAFKKKAIVEDQGYEHYIELAFDELENIANDINSYYADDNTDLSYIGNFLKQLDDHAFQMLAKQMAGEVENNYDYGTDTGPTSHISLPVLAREVRLMTS